MNCAEVKERLSAFYDAELSSAESAQLASHVDACPNCAQLRHGFQALSAGVRQLGVPAPPSAIWGQIEQQLDAPPKAGPIERTHRMESTIWPRWAQNRVLRPAFALAALVLIAIGLLAFESWFTPGGGNVLAADFALYAEEFSSNPEEAQQLLLAKYDGRQIDLADAVQHVDYRPAAADGMPSGYSLNSVYVLKMPCCDCLQTICQRRDGSRIAIFEYGNQQRVTFGDRPESNMQCNGKSCRMVEVNDQFAVNSEQGGPHISIVGPRDQADIENLVSWLK